jgi:putative drug exporter of the RND superfamily
MVFTKIAQGVAHKRISAAIIVVWVLVVVASFALPRAKTSSQQQDFLPASDDSIRAQHLADDPAKFPRGNAFILPLTLIFRNDAGLQPADIDAARAVDQAIAGKQDKRLSLVSGVASVFTQDTLQPGQPLPKDARFVSSDGKTLTATVLFNDSNDKKVADGVNAIEDLLKEQHGAPGLTTGVAGPAVQISDSNKAFANLSGKVTTVTVILIFVLLLAIYRSPILPLIPLLSVALAFLLSNGLFGAIANAAGLKVNPQSSSLTIVLILGAGTDYSLFIISRYREELRQYQSKYEAMWHTMANVGEAIASSALIVVVTLVTLILASLTFFSNLGPSAALAIACMLVAGLTLVPSILLLLGRVAFWPFVPRYGEQHAEDSGIWTRVAGAVAARPGVVAAATIAVFVVLALGSFGLKQRFDFVSNFPASYPSRQGQQLLEKAGPQDVGKLAPTNIYVTSDGPILDHVDQLAAISSALKGEKGVASVAGFEGQTAQQVQQSNQLLPPTQRTISADGKTARIDLNLATDPYGTPAMDLIASIRRAARAPVNGSGLTVNVGGNTAIQADERSDGNRDIALLGPIVFLAIGAILALLLRSIIAPLYLLATTLLSFFATLGLTVLVFQGLRGQSGIQNFVPTFMAIFLVALGADYNVFIMSRVREEALREGVHDGTRKAIARTGGVITSAGIILAGTFAALITQPLELLQQIGFAVAAGILLDTFVVRALLVPSIVLLLGKWNWWPSKAMRQIPARRTEPAPTGD